MAKITLNINKARLMYVPDILRETVGNQVLALLNSRTAVLFPEGEDLILALVFRKRAN